MKIAYFSYLPLADVDFSFLHEAQKIMDITCFLFVNPKHIKGSVLPIINIKNTSAGIYNSNIYPELEIYKDFIDLSKIKIINIPDSKEWQYNAFKIFYELSKELNREYDIIHLTNILQWYEFPLYFLSKKVILTVHDPLTHSTRFSIKNYLWELLRRVSFYRFSKFIILNKKQLDIFKSKYNLYEKEIFVSALSIYTCLKYVPTSIGYEDGKYILFFGRISKYKGLNYLLPAFSSLSKLRNDIKLVVAGNGEFDFDISAYKKNSNIYIINRYIADSELINLIKGCEFVVCPYTDATQSGVVMSAFAFGKPILATNVGGLPEMVKNMRHGIIVREKDTKALEEGLLYMISNPQLIKEFSSNINADYIDGEKSWKKIALELLDFYKSNL